MRKFFIFLLILIHSNFVSAITITHDISVNSLTISSSSVDDYIITGSTTHNYVVVGFGYKGTITLKDCEFDFSNGSNSPICITGKENLSNTDPSRTNVNLILDGYNVIYNNGGGRACIQVDQGAQINISAIDPCLNSSGILVVEQANSSGGAGIGSRSDGGYEPTSEVILSNGKTATTAGGNIVISSGTITAKGGHGAGIGGGFLTYYDGMIVIYGGIVNATAIFDAAGIGSGCPRGTGLVEEYAPNSAIVVLPPAIISAKGAGESASGGVGTSLFPELGLAGTKVRVYIGDPDKPTINIKTIDNKPNANIYFDLSQDSDVNRVVSSTIKSSVLDINSVLLGRTDEFGTFSTTGSLINPTVFFTDAMSNIGNPYLPEEKILPNGGSIELGILQTDFNIHQKNSSMLELNYTSVDARKSATILKISYKDVKPMTDITFDFASGVLTSFSEPIFLASDSSTIIPTPTTLKQGDVYYVIIPIKQAQEAKVHTDVLRIIGTWNGASTGYIRQVINQIVADVRTVNICKGESYYFNGKNLTESGIYVDTSTVSSTCATGLNLNEVIRLVVSPPKYLVDRVTLCDSELPFEWGDTIFDGGTTSGLYNIYRKTKDGCDSILSLYLTVNPSYLFEERATICDNVGYDFRGRKVFKSGVYYDSYVTQYGCDSIYKLILKALPSYHVKDTIYICENDSVYLNGGFVKEKGVYLDTLKTIWGCDSIIQTLVRYRPTFLFEEYATICKNETYLFQGIEYNKAGTYYHNYTSKFGCDSIYKLTIDVLPSYFIPIYAEICHDQSYFFRGRELDAHGIYYDSLYTKLGCDSIYMLVLNTTPIYLIEDTINICEGDYYNFRGRNICEPGFYYDSLRTVSGCDSVYKLLLIVTPRFYQEIDTTICGNEYYNFRGKLLNKTGVYYDSIKTPFGCDSIYKLNLYVNETYINETYIELCEGDVFTFRGKDVFEPGIYYDSLYTQRGCDSIYKLIYNRAPSYLFEFYDTICSNKYYDFRGRLLNKPGIYFDSLKTVSGCDSVYKLDLKVNPSYVYKNEFIDSICDNSEFYFGGIHITQSGVYYDSLTTNCGCDSVYIVNVKMNTSYLIEEFATICDYEQYYFRGNLYNKSGIYWDSLVTFNGCDSVYKLDLRVTPTYRDTIVDTICLGEEYNFRGKILTQKGLYIDTIYNPVSDSCEVVHLHLYTKPSSVITSVKTNEVCANDSIYEIIYKYYGERPISYSIYYDNKAQAVGFNNVIDHPFVDTIYDYIPQPDIDYVRPDLYNVRLEFNNGICNPSLTGLDFQLLVRYPSWIIEQNWNDVVATLNADYNGGYVFDKYEWYVNGRLLDIYRGANLYLNDINIGDKVELYLTREGEAISIPTCPIFIEDKTNEEQSEYPVIVNTTILSKQNARMSIVAKEEGYYVMYDICGHPLFSGKYKNGDCLELQVPELSGCYILQLYTENYGSKSVKVIIH